jgi:hypothetical protein
MGGTGDGGVETTFETGFTVMKLLVMKLLWGVAAL